jgi:hypothetical protein
MKEKKIRRTRRINVVKRKEESKSERWRVCVQSLRKCIFYSRTEDDKDVSFMLLKLLPCNDECLL